MDKVDILSRTLIDDEAKNFLIKYRPDALKEATGEANCNESTTSKKDKKNIRIIISNILNSNNTFCMFVSAIRRKIRYKKLNKRIPFYKYQVMQENNQPINLM